MSNKPIIQVAMDYIETKDAVEMSKIVAPAVEAIEIGTPLCKAEGMHAVRAVREACPDHIIMADMKTPDVGGLEAQIAFDAGADWMTVLGAAPADTLRLALQEAASRPGHEVLVELTGIQDISSRAKTWRAMGVERMVYHRGWDEGNLSRTWEDSDRATLNSRRPRTRDARFLRRPADFGLRCRACNSRHTRSSGHGARVPGADS
jgi:3-dehydro-L-gulonate-6-phosphate decarboxylase